MWHAQIETIVDGHIERFTIARNDSPLQYSAVIDLWQSSETFRSFFIDLLRKSTFDAFRWETPPLTSTNRDRDFEFVLLRSDRLDRAVDAKAFASHFTADDVVTFQNLGGDATLVVPCPMAHQSVYGHLAPFLRHAPDRQIHRLWETVGRALQDRLDDEPVWLSTAGMGVSWLHVRLDDHPKYYGYAPYKKV